MKKLFVVLAGALVFPAAQATRTGLILCGVILTVTVAAVVAFVVVQRRTPAPLRSDLAVVLAITGALVGAFAGASVLNAPPVTLFNVALVAVAAILTGAALLLQRQVRQEGICRYTEAILAGVPTQYAVPAHPRPAQMVGAGR